MISVRRLEALIAFVLSFIVMTLVNAGIYVVVGLALAVTYNKLILPNVAATEEAMWWHGALVFLSIRMIAGLFIKRGRQ